MTNLNSMAKTGRPLKFQSVEELEASCDRYFEQTPKEEWTITGLAIFLDTCRSTLMDYTRGIGDRAEFSNAIKKAKLKVEHAYECRLVKRGNSGDIFALKNMGWEDKQTNENVNRNLNSDVELSEDQQTQIANALDAFKYTKPGASKAVNKQGDKAGASKKV